MSTSQETGREQWSGQVIFILAATGSTVGLSNFWTFPYITGENGGGAFLLIYVLCLLLVGIPVMIAELMLGRLGGGNPVRSMRALAAGEHARRGWSLVGWSGLIAGFLNLSYYSVIAGWAMAYVFRAGSGLFTGQTLDGVRSVFTNLIDQPERLLAWHTLFMLLTTLVVARGLRAGLEAAVRCLVPLLFLFLLLLTGFAWHSGAFGQGVHLMFHADFSRISWQAALAALGQAFFTLSLGRGAIMMYGARLPKHVPIVSSVFAVALLDTLVALLAGVVVYSIILANGLEPDKGAALVFQTLPQAFGQMAHGAFFGMLFFVMLVFAAWSSAISLLEPAVAWLVETRNVSRIRGAILAGMAVWAVGLVTIFSLNRWSGYHPLSALRPFRASTVFNLLDFLTAGILLPLGGLLIAIFSGWIMSRESSAGELGLHARLFHPPWRFIVRYVAPPGIVVVLLHAIHLF
jgi:NSS family neurotransmitter:Na+ symporter